MFQLNHHHFDTKEALYEQLLLSAKGLIEGERDLIANLANIASLIYHSLDNVNWAGFYLFKEEQLVLGPFNGKPACIRIPIGKGVCGTAAFNRATVIVQNVHEFEGHIACDAETFSEIVVPMLKNGQLVGVLDIDSIQINNFDEIDQINLEALIDVLMKICVI